MDQLKGFTLAEIAEMTGSTLVGDPQYRIFKVDNIESADASSVSFLDNPNYTGRLKNSQAGALFVSKKINLIEGRNFLISDSPSLAFQQVLEALDEKWMEFSGFQGIHLTAVIHSTCQIGQNVTIGPNAVLDKGVIVKDHTVISANCYIGPYSQVGCNCHLHPGVIVRERCILGDRVILQPGAVIGSCGFGYLTNKQGEHIKLNQVGNVIVEDDVEIGANTTIDRARFGSTFIKKGSKIDNLVQIAHNVTVGERNILVAQVGIAGSTKTGKYVIFGGQSGAVGHIKIADHVTVAAQTGVNKSIEEVGSTHRGSPAFPIGQFNRNLVHLKNIGQYVEQIKTLQKEVQALREKLSC